MGQNPIPLYVYIYSSVIKGDKNSMSNYNISVSLSPLFTTTNHSYSCAGITVKPLQVATPMIPTDETDELQSVEIDTSEDDKRKTLVDDCTCHTIFASLSNMVFRRKNISDRSYVLQFSLFFFLTTL